jgi:hypothetical protein
MKPIKMPQCASQTHAVMSEPFAIEQVGWSRIANSVADLDRVEDALASYGFEVQPFDVTPHTSGFRTHFADPVYAGDYRTYPGEAAHAIVEKALEHYLSLLFRVPRCGETVVDIGSCESVVPTLVRRKFGAVCYEQDLAYPSGLNGYRIGCNAASIPLPDRSVDLMTLHCTFEHFEGTADTAYVRECARLLRPGGATVILPLYLNLHHVNITGEADPNRRAQIGWDLDATWHCVVPEWQNRFGRHYSPAALVARVLQPASAAGLQVRVLRVRGIEALDARLWCKWILILART